MNTFHEINLMTSRGDINGAFLLIRDRSESVARKIMKRAGYSVPVHTGRAFWSWVQDTLLKSSREQKNGWQARAERKTPARGYRQQIQEDHGARAKMMSPPVPEEDTTAPAPAENEDKATIVSARPYRDEQIVKSNMPAMLTMKIISRRAISRCINIGNQCRQALNYSCPNVWISAFTAGMLCITALSLLIFYVCSERCREKLLRLRQPPVSYCCMKLFLILVCAGQRYLSQYLLILREQAVLAAAGRPGEARG